MNGHRWSAYTCQLCGIHSWTEASNWPCPKAEAEDAPVKDLCLYCCNELSGNVEIRDEHYPYCSMRCVIDAERDSQEDEPCKSDGTPIYPRRKLTRQEQLEGLADRGIDTLEDYLGVK
jgi:hypothetical protein